MNGRVGHRGAHDVGHGDEKRAANWMVAATRFCGQGVGTGKKVNPHDQADEAPPRFHAATEVGPLDEHPR